ncbi:MAG: ferrochelatase [Gammaproteobacteria bacterium]|nr:ferrochelatase [Gammaproteobacteria bacterium]
MAYRNHSDFDHSQVGRIGVLITNLGTPTEPTPRGVRPFLREFLSDPRVVEIPRLLWWIILNGIVLPIRPARSARAYKSIWTEAGSPLLIHTRAQADALQLKLRDEYGEQVLVDCAFRYGEPSIGHGVQSLLDQGARRVLVLPLYPQYSSATGGSTFDALAGDFSRRRWLPELRFITHYHDNPAYITALAESITAFRELHGGAQKLVFSFHGTPRSFLENGDPYYCECQKTARLLARQLGLQDDEHVTTFQSRFGAAQWLQPYTDVTLQELAAQGINSVQVVCPGFSADCLETLAEIAIENRDLYLTAGGERYEYIPALNAEPAHIEMLASLVGDNLQGWLREPEDALASKQRALSLGAEK